MNTELLKAIEVQLLEAIGTLTLQDYDLALQKLKIMRQGIRLIIAAQEKYPMTTEELETEFQIRKRTASERKS